MPGSDRAGQRELRGSRLHRGFSRPPAQDVPGWDTTASDELIEIWQDGHLSVPASDGEQFSELNATASVRVTRSAATPARGSRRPRVAARQSGLLTSRPKWAGQESNLRPMDYESTALTAELPARGAGLRLVGSPSMVDGWSTRIPFRAILGPLAAPAPNASCWTSRRALATFSAAGKRGAPRNSLITCA